jgi:hypothetical protein
MGPRARRDALLLQTVGDQLVLYDQNRRRLHVLSRSAAMLWQYCDGERDVSQLAELVGRELGTAADNAVVELALQQLEEAGLLAVRTDVTRRPNSVSRREMLNVAMGGLAAGVLLPVVTSCGSIVDAAVGAARANLSDVGIQVVTTIATTVTTGTGPPTTTSTTGTTTTSTTGTSTTSTTGTGPPTTTSTTSTAAPTTTSTSTTGTTTTTEPPRKVAMCHNGKTIMVDQHAVDAHLRHGDTMGPCPP